MKRIIYISGIVILSALLLSCETEPPKPDTPIFSDVEILEVSEGTGKYIFEDLPSYVKYVQVLIFASGNTPVVDDDSKLIKNPEVMKGGNRTGLNGISRTDVSLFYDYDPVTEDFDSGTAMAAMTTTDWFIVLGFDEALNLTHASPMYKESDL